MKSSHSNSHHNHAHHEDTHQHDHHDHDHDNHNDHHHEEEHHDHHGHGHGHHHHHEIPATFNLAFGIAVGLNLSFTLLEAIFAFVANSMSLLADAGHNLADVLSLLVAWAASWLLTRAASGRFSYGFKRSSILAALFNALFLLLTSIMITYDSLLKLFNPTPVHEWIVVIVALVGIFVNGGTAMMFARGRHDDLNIKAVFLHLAADAVISLGVVVTAIIIMYTKWVLLDPVVGLVIVATILISTWGLLRDSIHLIMDAVPHGTDQNAVRDYLKNLPGVVDVHDIHIWGLSTKETALTAHLIIPDRALSDDDYHEINRVLKTKFKISHATIQVEKGSKSLDCKTTC